ncbi:MAG TPA: cell division protein FtsZ, partial [Polyangia bacterium]|nr:cell division protein FtsZ [Polyangia bacterium]
LVIAPGLINVDFADVRTIMTGMGRALMGTGMGTGDKRAIEAAQQAISSPLLEDVSINGATGILLNITGGPDLTLAEMNEACSLIAEAADPDANIIFGSVIDANAGDQVRITVIATGFQSHVQDHPTPNSGRGHARSREGQMALPMQPAAAQAATVPAMATAPWPAATTPTNRGGYAAPSETINTDDFYLNMEQIPPAPLPPQSGAEWTPAERPIIRPQSAGTAPLQRRVSGQVPAQRSPDELGVEESEFDKPTYLRRGLYAPE